MDNRFFEWLSVCWGFFSSCLCFAAPAADEVRAAVEGFADGGPSAVSTTRRSSLESRRHVPDPRVGLVPEGLRVT
jgi:hypothetical protein